MPPSAILVTALPPILTVPPWLIVKPPAVTVPLNVGLALNANEIVPLAALVVILLSPLIVTVSPSKRLNVPLSPAKFSPLARVVLIVVIAVLFEPAFVDRSDTFVFSALVLPSNAVKAAPTLSWFLAVGVLPDTSVIL